MSVPGFRHYPPGDGRPVRWLGHTDRYLTTGDESAGRYCLSHGHVPPGGGPPPHVQTREDEAFYVLRGELLFTAGDRTARLPAGSLIQIRRGTAHRFTNDRDEPAEVLCVNAPAGFDRFQFLAGGDPPDVAKLAQYAPAFGIDLHPAPERFREPPDVRVLLPGEGRTVWAAGDRYTFKLEAADTHGLYALWEAFIPPGGGPPLHVHSREDEAFYVLAGSLQFTLAGDQFDAGPGTFVSLPPGTPHKFHNAAGVPARALLLVCPAGLERMFDETGTPAAPDSPEPPGSPDVPAMAAAATKYGVTIIEGGHP